MEGKRQEWNGSRKKPPQGQETNESDRCEVREGEREGRGENGWAGKGGEGGGWACFNMKSVKSWGKKKLDVLFVLLDVHF